MDSSDSDHSLVALGLALSMSLAEAQDAQDAYGRSVMTTHELADVFEELLAASAAYDPVVVLAEYLNALIVSDATLLWRGNHRPLSEFFELHNYEPWVRTHHLQPRLSGRMIVPLPLNHQQRVELAELGDYLRIDVVRFDGAERLTQDAFREILRDLCRLPIMQFVTAVEFTRDFPELPSLLACAHQELICRSDPFFCGHPIEDLSR